MLSKCFSLGFAIVVAALIVSHGQAARAGGVGTDGRVASTVGTFGGGYGRDDSPDSPGTPPSGVRPLSPDEQRVYVFLSMVANSATVSIDAETNAANAPSDDDTDSSLVPRSALATGSDGCNATPTSLLTLSSVVLLLWRRRKR